MRSQPSPPTQRTSSAGPSQPDDRQQRRPQGSASAKTTGGITKIITTKDPPFGFFRVHASCARAVQGALGEAAVSKEHYFQLKWLPSIGEYVTPVQVGDELACVISLDERDKTSSRETRFRLKQLQIERCRYLSGEQMLAYLKAVHRIASSDAEGVLIAMGKCAAPWRFILSSDQFEPTFTNELVHLVLETLHVIYPSHALTEKCAHAD